MMGRRLCLSPESQIRGPKPRAEGRPQPLHLSVAETICESMAHAAQDLDVKAIAVFTETGTTARQLSKYRPAPPIYALPASMS